MRIEYEKLFSTPDELTNFLCKSNEEQNKVLAELLVNNKTGNSVELSCKTCVKVTDIKF